ncbi:MAG: hypothetical protein ACOZE5_10440 [Verrucomicrobiota bacterium]
MLPLHRLDWLFGIGHGIALLGFAAHRLAPEWFAGSLLQSLHILCGVSVFSVFLLWALLHLARLEMDSRSRLLWLAALLIASPLVLPLIYVRFLRPTLAAS